MPSTELGQAGVLCDELVLIKLKGKFYKTMARPALLFGLECWAVDTGREPRVVWPSNEARRGPGSADQGLRLEDRQGRGRPELTWKQVVQVDMIVCRKDGTLAEKRRA